jgi:hypothetical protein
MHFQLFPTIILFKPLWLPDGRQIYSPRLHYTGLLSDWVKFCRYWKAWRFLISETQINMAILSIETNKHLLLTIAP